MREKTTKCAHPVCTCTVSGNDKYCSPLCEAAGDTTEIACDCGHATCATSEVKGGQPARTASS